MIIITYHTLLKAHFIMIVIPLHVYSTVLIIDLEGMCLKLNKKHLQL